MEVVVIATASATPCDRELIIHTSQDIQDDMAHNGEILSSIFLAHTRVIFAEGHIKTPVQGIFNAPMTSGRNGKLLDILQ